VAYPYWILSQKDLQSRRAIGSAGTSETAQAILPQLVGKDVLPDGVGGQVQRDFPNPSFQVLKQQAYVALRASNSAEADGPLDVLFGKDTLPDGVGGEVQRDQPNPSFLVLRAQNVVALIAAEVGQYDTPLPSFVGQDRFYDGPGKAPNFDEPNPSFAVVGKQAFVARLSADAGNWNGPLPLLGNVVSLPPGASCCDGCGTTLTPTNAAAVARQRAGYAAAIACDMGAGWDAFTLELIGQDQFAPGEQLSGNPPAGARRAVDYTWLYTPLPILFGQDALAVGDQSFVLPTPAVLRARDYTIAASFPLELIAQDAMATGEQLSGNAPPTAARARTLASDPGANYTLALATAAAVIPPGEAALDQQYRTTPRAREYGQTSAFFHGLDGQDAMATGEQISGNAPAGARRASTLGDPGSNPIPLLTSVAPPFIQTTAPCDLPPRGAPRARDYSFTAGFFHGLDGQDSMAAGEQLSGNAPAGPRRAIDYTWLYTPLPLLFGQDTLAAGAQVYDLPARAAARARDYSFSASYFQGLIAQDAMVVGDQLSGNTPATAPRASTLSEPGVNLTIILTAAPPTIPYGLSTALSELYPRAAARARDYSFSASYFQGLIGKDVLPNGAGGQVQEDWPNPSFAVPLAQSRIARTAADVGQFDTPLPIFVGLDQFPNGIGGQVLRDWPNPPRGAPRASTLSDPGVNNTALAPTVPPPPGAQSFDLPPKAAPRAKDYSFTASYFAGLIGKDALPTGRSTGPTEIPPKAPARARDYTWLQTLPLHVYQQLPTGASTEASVLPPRGPARARDYTFLRSLPVHLIGQETLYGAPGEVPAYDWQLPPRAAPRLRDYTHSATAPYGSGIPPRDLLYIAGVPFANWVIGAIAPDVHWVIGPPQPEVATGAPQQ